MIYKYDEKIVNNSNNFADKNNFVGYILPDGTIYTCKNHNVSNAYTILTMFLMLLDKDYDNSKELLNHETNDKLIQVIIYKLKKMSHDEIHALLELMENGLMLSDVLVLFFGCHMITRFRRHIITGENNHMCFYNYLLHDFKIDTLPRVIFDREKKEYKFIETYDRNGYLYDEIKKIKSEIDDEEVDLFIK